MPSGVAGRGVWDLSHKVMQAMKIGRLTTVCRIPTLPGDSLSGRVDVFFRANPLRRPVPFDLRLDLLGFWQPYRWTYPTIYSFNTNWQEVTAPTSAISEVTTKGHIDALLLNTGALSGAKVPAHLVYDYTRIYNHYFKEPHQTDVANTVLDGTDNDTNHYGMPVGNIEDYQSSTNLTTTPGGSGERLEPIDVINASTNSYALDVSELGHTIAEWRQGRVEQWMGVRFEEEFAAFFGTRPPAEVAKVPEFLGRSSKWLSSHDIDGTSGDQFGSAIGKMTGYASWRMPRKFFREHGTLFVLACARPRVVWQNARHLLDLSSDFRNGALRNAVPANAAQLPDAMNLSRLFWDGKSGVAAGYHPALQHYRCHPSYVSSILDSANAGWEGRATPATSAPTRYVPNYDDVFATAQGGHGLMVCDNSISARRVVPEPSESVFGDM